MAGQLLAAVEGFRSKVREALAEAEIGHRKSLRSAQETIKAARDFVTKSDVGGAALRVYDSTLPYHAWSKRDDWAKWNVIGVTEVRERTGPLPNCTGFRWRDRYWVFALEEHGSSYSDDEALGRFSVEVDGELVMELAVAKSFWEFACWRPIDVYAFTIGPWVGTLVEMDATLELGKQQRSAEMEAERLEHRASRIKL